MIWRKPVISLQLYSVRKLGTIDDQLSAVSAAGFTAVEALEAHLAAPRDLRRLLDDHGLKAPSVHVSLQSLISDPNSIEDACGLCGISQVFVPTVEDSLQADTTDGWQRLGESMGKIADLLQDAGVGLGYHNKALGFSELRGGRYGFEVLFNAAQGSSLKWQADIAWLTRAGLEPIEWLRRYHKILVSAHVKDQAPVDSNLDEDGWSDIGSGVLAWPSLWKAALDCGAKSLIVEHDNPKDPFLFARRSFAYVSRFDR